MVKIFMECCLVFFFPPPPLSTLKYYNVRYWREALTALLNGAYSKNTAAKSRNLERRRRKIKVSSGCVASHSWWGSLQCVCVCVCGFFPPPTTCPCVCVCVSACLRLLRVCVRVRVQLICARRETAGWNQSPFSGQQNKHRPAGERERDRERERETAGLQTESSYTRCERHVNKTLMTVTAQLSLMKNK